MIEESLSEPVTKQGRTIENRTDMKHGGMAHSGSSPEPAIRWQGRRFSIPAACELGIQEHLL